jgi:4a-hydroxytetrahydrobiopterin dehydratase
MWNTIKWKLQKTFVFRDFKEALAFINNVWIIAEKQNHHPDIYLYAYNKVDIVCYTHSSHWLTDKDKELSELIDKILAPWFEFFA